MLWLGLNKRLKILIGDENVETFMEDATVRVCMFLYSTVTQLASSLAYLHTGISLFLSVILARI